MAHSKYGTTENIKYANLHCEHVIVFHSCGMLALCSGHRTCDDQQVVGLSSGHIAAGQQLWACCLHAHASGVI